MAAEEEREPFIVVALRRAGAENLVAVAADGLDSDDEEGLAALAALRSVLASEPDDELRVIARGLIALESFFSHDKDFIIFDSDGTGLLSGEDYSNLYGLFALMRGEYEDATKED